MKPASSLRVVSPAGLPSVASPCINVCQMDAVTGRCQGCWRTLAEIAAWRGTDDAGKRGILAAVEQRRAYQDPETDLICNCRE